MLTKQLFNTNFSIGSKLALAKTQDSTKGYSSASKDYQAMLNKAGKAMTILRPSGKVEIDGDMYDATAITGFIESGENIEVVNYQTGQLFVKKRDA